MDLYINIGITFHYNNSYLDNDSLNWIISRMIYDCVRESGIPGDVAAFAINMAWEHVDISFDSDKITHGYCWIQEAVSLPGTPKDLDKLNNTFSSRGNFFIQGDEAVGEVEYVLFVAEPTLQEGRPWNMLWHPIFVDPQAYHVKRNPDVVAYKFGFQHLIYP
uniref:U1 protein n=1 Tax=Hapavirus flanders TaxID=1972612 RepID=T2FFU1_9RHAB|nr:U1 protein [Hapavirus flanders]